jgi:Uma2 family endonuclease
MSTAHTQTLPAPTGPVTFRWTRDDYYNAAAAGLFNGRHVQLLEGEVVEMAPQGQPHVIAVSYALDALRPAFPYGYWVRAQAPLRVGEASDPEPDLSVVIGSPSDYPIDPPATAVLIIEVSDSTLQLDRRRKARIYAAANISDYWILNLVDRRLEVLRSPTTGPAPAYAAPLILSERDSISPLAAPHASIAIARLLP